MIIYIYDIYIYDNIFIYMIICIHIYIYIILYIYIYIYIYYIVYYLLYIFLFILYYILIILYIIFYILYIIYDILYYIYYIIYCIFYTYPIISLSSSMGKNPLTKRCHRRWWGCFDSLRSNSWKSTRQTLGPGCVARNGGCFCPWKLGIYDDLFGLNGISWRFWIGDFLGLNQSEFPWGFSEWNLSNDFMGDSNGN